MESARLDRKLEIQGPGHALGVAIFQVAMTRTGGFSRPSPAVPGILFPKIHPFTAFSRMRLRGAGALAWSAIARYDGG